MQHQPPDDNNPANPLMKAAALDIDKTYLKTGNDKQIELEATLNFKRSDDFRGRATGPNGEDFTVVFGASISKATLEVVCSFEQDSSKVKISDVPFVSELANTKLISSDMSYDLDRLKSLGTELAGSVSSNDGETAAAVSAKASSAKNTSSKKKMRIESKSRRLNVNGTFGGTRIHWTIAPDHQFDGMDFLNGEVFASEEGKKLTAAKVGWRSDKVGSPLNVSASVRVFMEDIKIHGVAILDEFGEPVGWGGLRQMPEVRGNSGAFTGTKQMKERLVKQIIRNHLLKQGMRIEGASLEICAANA